MGHQSQEPWRERKTYGFSTIDKEFSSMPSVYSVLGAIPWSIQLSQYTYIYTYTMPTAWHTHLLLIMSKLLWQLTLSRLIHIYIKNTSQRAENCLMETECWVSIAWGCLAIMLHEIRHSLFQLLKIRSHEKWQSIRRRKKAQTFLILWYLNYEIRNYVMWRNNWYWQWNLEGCIAALRRCHDSGNFNDPRRIFLTPFA